MIVWRWIRERRWWWQLAIFGAGVPVCLLLLYVAGRSLQYLVAEDDAGIYAPERAHALIRLRNLDGHLDRLESTFAWNTIERKLLRDPAFRRPLNAALRDAGWPTLDDLQDPRRKGPFGRAELYRFAGRDLVAAVVAPDEWRTAKFCGATRLGWLEYLATPFAPLVLPRDGDVLRAGKQIWVGFRGALAVGGNDKALVEEALRGRGRPPAGDRPVEAVVRFDGSRALAALRTEIAGLGLLPHVRLETAKAVTLSADLDGTAARIDAVLEDVEAAYPGQGAPNAFLARAPSSTTGTLSSTAAFRDVYAWAKGRGRLARELSEQLERGKLTEVLLPLLDPGLALITGAAENEGKLYPAFALVVPTSDPARAVEALTEVVKKIGGKFAESKLETEQVGDVEVRFMDPPDGAGIDDFLLPTWGATEGALVFGNNLVFTKAVLASGGDLWRDRRLTKRLFVRLKEMGFSERPGLAGGVLVPPMLKESLDGVIQYFSRSMALPSDAEFRQMLEREWAEQGRSNLPEQEKTELFLQAREARIQEYEADLRRGLRILDPVRWLAFESAAVPGGVSLRLAVGFDSLTER